MSVTRREATLIVIIVIAVAVIVGMLLLPHENIPQQSKAVESSESVTVNPTEQPSEQEPVESESVTPGAIKINPQSLGNLPWPYMRGRITDDEMIMITGVSVSSLKGTKVSTVDWGFVRFKRIGFLVDQSYDKGDRKFYWAENVDVQRYNTFGVDSRDEYSLEKIGDMYVARDDHNRICFFGYGLEKSEGQQRIQSFVNVPWQNLSGSMSLKTVTDEFDFHLRRSDYYYNPKLVADEQIMSYVASSLENRKRGQLVAYRGQLEQGIFLFNGKVYKTEGIEIQPGDYPGGINPVGVTPPFRLLTVRAGQPEEKVYVLLFYDENENLVAAIWTKNRIDMVAGGSGGSTSSFSSSSPSSGPPTGPGPRPPI